MKYVILLSGIFLFSIEYIFHVFTNQPILIIPYYILALALTSKTQLWHFIGAIIVYDLVSALPFGIITLVLFLIIITAGIARSHFENTQGLIVCYVISACVLRLGIFLFYPLVGWYTIGIQALILTGTVFLCSLFAHMYAQRI